MPMQRRLVPKTDVSEKRPTKRRLEPRGGPPKPPVDGWSLPTALRIVCGDELYISFDTLRRSFLRIADEPPIAIFPHRLTQYAAEMEYKDRLRVELIAKSRELWLIFRPIAQQAKYRMKGGRGELGGRLVEFDGGIWGSLEVFDGATMSLGSGVNGSARFFNVTVFPAESRGGGRTADYEWLKALDHLLTRIVDPEKLVNASRLAKDLDDAFDDLGMEVPSDSAKWLRDNLPKLNALAKTAEPKR